MKPKFLHLRNKVNANYIHNAEMGIDMEKKNLLQKTAQSLQEEGFHNTAKRIKNHISNRKKESVIAGQYYEPCMDVLFINGCDPVTVPHPPRYRISHQKEQLIANNICSNEVYYTALSLDQVRNYRIFIFFRCPYTPLIGEFIALAKKLHKVVLFDIDDLVIDTKYTDLLPYVKSLSKKEKAVYDDGVERMGKTLALCDGAITSTERLAEELKHYVPEVFLNRNTASELMLKYSEEVLHKQTKSKNLNKILPQIKDKSRQTRNIPKKRKKEQPDLTIRTKGEIRLGYFSGSITHNEDFKMILPAITKILKEYPNVTLHITGELTLPKALRPYKGQVIKREFVKWQRLPELIASVDINLAPIEDNIFNEAKSENKWTEAALVKVPTVASNVGAFKTMIQQNETGILCDETENWYEALKKLVESKEERTRIAENAYRYCKKNCVTTYTGFPLAKYIRSKMTPNAAFILPSLEISGGIMVALRHAGFLYDCGFDTFLISENPGSGWVDFEEYHFPVISRNHHPMYCHIDKAVATMWTTTQFLELYPHIQERFYLVQNFETDFYEPDIFLRIQANQSYSPSYPVQFLTISRWCQDWLLKTFEQNALYAPNGINSKSFRPHERSFSGRIRILIEGDCGVYYKNVDESFQIVDLLDPEQFEIWYMSYNAEPKTYYRVDRFLHKVSYGKVFEVYAQCDILLKSSFLESFSYPPLEMMASGGCVVVAPNDGNKEYLRDEENCLIYPLGDIEAAAKSIKRLCADATLRKKLYKGGLSTADSRDWEKARQQIVAMYTSGNDRISEMPV